jgi:HSP20 family protein
MSEKQTGTPSSRDQQLTRRSSSQLGRLTDEIDRFFDDFGFGRGWLASRFGRHSLMPRWWMGSRSDLDMWAPEVEVFQRDNNLVVRADLPGMTKDDVKIDITDEALTLQGERKREHEEEREGYYRSERSYGSFYRVLPLPQGAITNQAKATFRDGVLEITMPAPPQEVTQGRRIEITEGSSAKK